ncbi:hypothetical protein BCR33DRAFT_856252 [Rhizoclosmatium globosum]|uniref:PLAC8-domain-containing protein n=1 Tax=Rhizoclosmatium globosum TaxID=329046 RepID=A0A1Y2BFX5_9FUNG|nr:hypothetical protein HDU79_004244 [Rhizoclosmatium sp. JEL0117]ORY33616.1 hypothetical protein BCR33DRAFT_856252 [Rhizoclosmatium globosum]|eukprot:ORY33616.1 hypothetical protein BCR33DRAFT_856252 [Rhizoclosmatium globosum]
MSTDYSFGFWSCFSDLGTCCTVTWCPCFAVGSATAQANNTGDFDSSCCLFTLCCTEFTCIPAYMIRKKVQENYNIKEDDVTTLAAVVCCPVCSITQDMREMKKRKADQQDVLNKQPVGQPLMTAAN